MGFDFKWLIYMVEASGKVYVALFLICAERGKTKKMLLQSDLVTKKESVKRKNF